MSAPRDDEFGFAPDHDSPVPYMQRTRDYYSAIGYTTPYRWAHYTEAPFQPLKKKLAQSRVTIITTAAPYDPAKGDQGPGAAYNGSAKFYQVYDGDTSQQHDLRISHIGYDRKHTTATDNGTWFPLLQLLNAGAAGRIGEVAPRFFGAPTNRSHRVTLDTDAPEILARCLADQVDAAVLVPNCRGLPSDHSAGGAASGGQWHSDRDHGLRQGHHRARRRPALSVLGFPPRQFCRQAA
ncbi:hypothetical protein ACVWYK_005197 [Bradyrhizobium sp. USDA 4470]